MTQREITVRLCEAYIKAGKTVDLADVIKIASYIMAHTNEYTPYYTSITSNLNTGSPYLYTSTCDSASNVATASSALDDTQESITL